MSQTGDTTTSQLSQHALALRFLTRTLADAAGLWISSPHDPLALEPANILYIERLAHKISTEADSFGFPEISAIAAAIELMAAEGAGVGVPARERLALASRLNQQVAALNAHIQAEIDDRRAQESAGDLPMSAHLPRFSLRWK